MGSTSKSDQQQLKDAQQFVRDVQQRLDREKGIANDVKSTIQDHINALRHAIKENNSKSIKKLLVDGEALVEKHLGPQLKSTWRESVSYTHLTLPTTPYV